MVFVSVKTYCTRRNRCYAFTFEFFELLILSYITFVIFLHTVNY